MKVEGWGADGEERIGKEIRWGVGSAGGERWRRIGNETGRSGKRKDCGGGGGEVEGKGSAGERGWVGKEGRRGEEEKSRGNDRQ